ncbi:TetR/AcrR family transcriptional regulator [Aureimonas altamirensis]|uniref:TetR/AcrR family transcriptional regulator n=1 Tax=Aureimonas altamirensis TaxID=370622 RepID=UPI001E54E2E1|nr:TetR/AcrR family transcriptional regulator [Aureimonas altamirensis]UHD45257.1 TetR/AcrR family transcriptional regulator [Aureimonas altamirensis]
MPDDADTCRQNRVTQRDCLRRYHNDKCVIMMGKSMEKEDHRVEVAARRREKMRTSLVKAGFEVMARKGTAAGSIDDVVRQAGVARGSFYKYFSSMDELTHAVGVAVADEVILGLEPELTSMEDPALRLATGVKSVLRMVEEHPMLGRFLVRAGWPVEMSSGLLLEKIGGAVNEGIELKRFVSMPTSVAIALVGGVVLGCTQLIIEGASAESMSDAAVAVIMRGLGFGTSDAELIAATPLRPVSWQKGPLMASLMG